MIGWAYYGLVQGAAFAFFWVPLWWRHHHPMLPPLGLTVAVLLCLTRAWFYPGPRSIKPTPARTFVDQWPPPFDAWWGNPEDGVSGADALGSWPGAYNPRADSRWLAICWNCRNWLAGFNYRTWLWSSLAPNLQLAYTVPTWVPRIGDTRRMLRLGWQQLPASDGWSGPYTCRMVCSF